MIELALGFPTVVFTVMVCLSLIYWGFVIIGALDIDVLDFGGDVDGLLEGADGALDGAADGALDGAAEALDGAADGALDGAAEALDGAVDGALDGVADGALDGVAEGADGALEAAEAAESSTSVLADLLSALKLRSAPLTVVLSFISIFGWALSMIVMQYLSGASALVGAGVGLGAFVVALPITSVAIRPLGPVFKTQKGRSRSTLIGQTCTVTTGRVDADFGQATCRVGMDELLIQVRCEPEKQLGRDHEALIIEYDDAREAYMVEPLADPDS